MTEARIVLKSGEESRLSAGHLWVFSNEISGVEGEVEPGGVAELFSKDGKFFARGYYNPKSLIAFRVLTREKTEEINKEFFKKKINRALEYRKEVYPSLNSFRVIFGESDGLPGLVVDKYENYLAVQILSLGMEKLKQTVIEVLKEVLNPSGIIFRNESHSRQLEGLEPGKEIVYGEIPESLKIKENGFEFLVNLSAGQKTGHFFDQRDNRKIFAGYCRDKTVLDLFCHTGAFGIYAAGSGAKKVVCVDSSLPALETADKNAAANNLQNNMEFIHGDVPEFLAHSEKSNIKYDVIMLDPPALIKNKKSFHAGARLYAKLNETAMKCLSENGALATSSCSHHLSSADFRQMLQEASVRSGISFKMVESGAQAKDHPVLVSMPETEYLKFAILKRV